MRKGTCKHFNGIQNDTCEVGVDYEQFRIKGTPVFKTFPCFMGCLNCNQFQEPTDIEIADYESRIQHYIDIVVAIDAQVSKGVRYGHVPCKCGGTITFDYRGSLECRAKCDSCTWSAMS